MANALKKRLRRRTIPTVWSKGIFRPSKTNIESICQALDEFDYAAFVFAPDDVVNKREKILDAPRDNVVFEMGLFLGKLGRERVFFVVPRGTRLHLPTDLDGVVPVEYDPTDQTNNVDAAVAGASSVISQAIAESWKVWDEEVVEMAKSCWHRVKQLLIAEIDRAPERHKHPSVAELQAMPARAVLNLHYKIPKIDYWWWQPRLPIQTLLAAEMDMCWAPTDARVDSVRAQLKETDLAVREYEALTNPVPNLEAVTEVVGREPAEMWVERAGLLDRCREVLLTGIDGASERTRYPHRNELARENFDNLMSILRSVELPVHLMETYEAIYLAAQSVGSVNAGRGMPAWAVKKRRELATHLREILDEFDATYGGK